MKNETDDHILARQLIENRDRLLAYLISVVGDWDTAEEIFQEVSLVILKKAEQGLHVRHFKAWSREVARRTVLNYWKKKKKDPILVEPDVIDRIDHAYTARDEDEAHGDLLRKLRWCLEQLPSFARKLVDLRYEKNLSMKGMASELDRTPGSVQVALSRTRMVLADCMDKVTIE